MPASLPSLPGSAARWLVARPVWIVLAAWLLISWVNPVGYVGGGSDDGRYLEAARCIVAHQGWCVPTTHWAARWPVMLPLAGAIAMLGETRIALGLSGAIWAVAALVLLVAIVRRWSGDAAASIAGSVLALTPVFVLLSLAPNADIPELTFLLASLWLAMRGRGWTAGLMLGLAVAVRETAMVALIAVLLGWVVWRPTMAAMLRGAVGFAMPIAIEAAWHARSAGDALLRFHLAMQHTHIASTELAGGVSAGSPLFNLRLIQSWRPASGIHVHWLLDPALNLLASPVCGLTLLAAAAAMVLAGRSLPREAGFLAAATTGMAAALVFALAIDPKPRMFLPAIAAAAAIVGIAAPILWGRRKRAVLGALLILLPVKAFATVADHPNMAIAEATARRWLSPPPPGLTTDAETRSRLAMVPAARRVPIGRGPLRLTLENGPCRLPALRRVDIGSADTPFVAALRRTHMLLGDRATYSLCIARAA